MQWCLRGSRKLTNWIWGSKCAESIPQNSQNLWWTYITVCYFFTDFLKPHSLSFSSNSFISIILDKIIFLGKWSTNAAKSPPTTNKSADVSDASDNEEWVTSIFVFPNFFNTDEVLSFNLYANSEDSYFLNCKMFFWCYLAARHFSWPKTVICSDFLCSWLTFFQVSINYQPPI